MLSIDPADFSGVKHRISGCAGRLPAVSLCVVLSLSSMVDAFRSMLDELMGKERDVPLGKRQNKPLEFDDPDVCKYELVGLCPNRLFRNTKSDLGKISMSAGLPAQQA